MTPQIVEREWLKTLATHFVRCFPAKSLASRPAIHGAPRLDSTNGREASVFRSNDRRKWQRCCPFQPYKSTRHRVWPVFQTLENGRVSSITNLESGIVSSYACGIMDRATNISYRTSTGGLIRSLDYAYDKGTGMITNKVVSGDSSQLTVKSYQYDSIDRLVGKSASARHPIPLRSGRQPHISNLFQ
jgi:hypothetical protein